MKARYPIPYLYHDWLGLIWFADHLSIDAHQRKQSAPLPHVSGSEPKLACGASMARKFGKNNVIFL